MDASSASTHQLAASRRRSPLPGTDSLGGRGQPKSQSTARSGSWPVRCSLGVDRRRSSSGINDLLSLNYVRPDRRNCLREGARAVDPKPRQPRHLSAVEQAVHRRPRDGQPKRTLVVVVGSNGPASRLLARVTGGWGRSPERLQTTTALLNRKHEIACRTLGGQRPVRPTELPGTPIVDAATFHPKVQC